MKSLKIIAFLSLLAGVFSINKEENDVEYLCPLLDTYFFHTEDNLIEDFVIGSYVRCSEMCSSNQECKIWTFNFGSFSILPPSCRLFRYDAGHGTSVAALSGSRDCYPEF